MNTHFSATACALPDPERHPQAIAHLAKGEVGQAAALWQTAVVTDPSQIVCYWYLGLALLLQGEEAEAQIAWMTPLLEAESEQTQWIADLSHVLQVEAARQETTGAIETAWLIRQHLREINADDLPNLLQVLLLELKLNNASIDGEVLVQVTQEISQLQTAEPPLVHLLLQVIHQLLAFDPTHPAVLACVEASIPLLSVTHDAAEILLNKAKALFLAADVKTAAELCKLCVRLAPDDLNLLMASIPILLSVESGDAWLSIRLAEQCVAQLPTLTEKILACQHLLTGLMTTGGQWQRASAVYQHYKSLIAALLQAQQQTETQSSYPAALGSLVRGLTMGIFCFYFEDNPRSNRPLRNQVATIAQSQVSVYTGKQPYTHSRSANSPLKVGYLSECLRRHSISWLARWLFKHHDAERVEVHLYSTRQTHDPLQQALMHEFGDRFHAVNSTVAEIASQINQDEIDVLVELDSLTSFTNCAIVALKPAPIQVNWLGFDAAGLPAVDYFIADPYVLPESAQDYYSEQIWRLPHTYIAVDGFEVSAPSLRRDHLNIPTDAIVYLSSQTGLKRNAANVALQMQILNAVSNSYFLIKSLKSDQAALEAFFTEMAEAAGVSGDRLRFLPRVDSEAVHRANLGIADVVLDTFPYTGATTTLETLWMGIPLVTRVGEQFAARNSYTMLRNVGVTEGIAWTDEEYVEWGVRLGQDEALRQKISWQLRRSRQTSPLWNAHQFAGEMETAYIQMRTRYSGT